MTRYDPINDEQMRGWHVLVLFVRRPAYTRWGLSIKVAWTFRNYERQQRAATSA